MKDQLDRIEEMLKELLDEKLRKTNKRKRKDPRVKTLQEWSEYIVNRK